MKYYLSVTFHDRDKNNTQLAFHSRNMKCNNLPKHIFQLEQQQIGRDHLYLMSHDKVA